MPKQDVRVKQSIRKGRLVKSYVRKQERSNNALKAAIGAASVLGVSAATYLVLKKRYINNLDTAAKTLKANPDVGKVLSDDIKDMTFTIGGFGSGLVKTDESPLAQAKGLALGLKKGMSVSERKLHHIEPLDHKFTYNLSGNATKDDIRRVKFLSDRFFEGKNDEAVKLAEDIYSWHTKNPKKPINIYGFSAGTNLSRDVQYILNKKGVYVKNANLGGVDFRITPSNRSLNIMGDNDNVRYWKASNAYTVKGVNRHHPEDYLKNKEVKDMVFKYFYNLSPKD